MTGSVAGPAVSVITAHRNDLSGLDLTLTSIKSRGDRLFEQIVVDGSRAEVEAEVRARVRDLESVILVTGSSGGVYKAMQDGLAHASGEYVMFLNAGDEIHPSLDQETFLGALRELRFDWGYGQATLVDSSLRERPSRKFDYSSERQRRFRRGRFPLHPATVISRSFAKRVGTFSRDLSIAADYEYMLRMAAVSDPVEFPHVLVRFHLGGVSSKRWFTSMLQAHKARRRVYCLGARGALLDGVLTAPAVGRAITSRLAGRV